jgi:D-glycero-D-manno-heptose 1,7-bisphosphate phosphatase
MAIKTIFLDRDGVINKEINYLYKKNDFIFINGIFEACLYFQSQGYKIIIVTNQSGIHRGYYNEEDFKLLSDWMCSKFINQGINILDIFHCPHDPKSNCDCRKPKPGMFFKAQQKYNINMNKSWMIGDKEVDIKAANAAGIKKTILVRSGHPIDETNSKSRFIIDSIKDSTNIIEN